MLMVMPVWHPASYKNASWNFKAQIFGMGDIWFLVEMRCLRTTLNLKPYFSLSSAWTAGRTTSCQPSIPVALENSLEFFHLSIYELRKINAELIFLRNERKTLFLKRGQKIISFLAHCGICKKVRKGILNIRK